MFKFFTILILAVAFFSRFYSLDLHPISPYWEEVALGYDAYSISQTLRDHHGNFLPLSAFFSFGDYKPSLYFYAIVPFIKIFGLDLFAVRLPTILASLALVIGTAVLARFLFLHFYKPKDTKSADFVFLTSLFLASISPWLLVFSRSAWESVLASSLLLWGFNFGLFFIKENKAKYLLISSILLTLSMYAYHGARLTAPLLGILLIFSYFFHQLFLVKKNSNYKALVISFFATLLLVFPVAKSLFEQSGQQRIAETSIFNEIAIIEASNQAKEKYDNAWWTDIIFHRYFFFGREALANFLSHFSFNYLFVSGDSNPRHSIQTFGNFYLVDLLLFVFAIYFIFSTRRKITLLLLLYIFVAILPAAFTKATPHALRTLAAWPMFIVFISFAWWQMGNLLKNAAAVKYLHLTLIVVYLCFFLNFFYQLLFVYPEKYRQEWQFGYEEMIEKLGSREQKYDRVYVTREKGRPAMYYFFYQKTDPRQVQSQAEKASKDQGEFLDFSNVNFIDKKDQVDFDQNILLVSSPKFYDTHFEDAAFTMIDETKDAVWAFYEN